MAPMTPEATEINRFYAGPHGARAARLIAQALAAWLQPSPLVRLLGIGPCAPLLTGFNPARVERVVVADPFGLAPWPSAERNSVCVARDKALPFADALFDCAIVMHTLEYAPRPEKGLRELWRVLAPGGAALFVVAARGGLWTHFETTPFGHGRPYGKAQLERLLTGSMFEVRACRQLLVAPPVRWLRPLDRVLTATLPGLGGVHVVRTVKTDGFGAAVVGAPATSQRAAVASG